MLKNKELHDHLPNSMPFKIQGRATDRIYFYASGGTSS
jgi:hypothetical protein